MIVMALLSRQGVRRASDSCVKVSGLGALVGLPSGFAIEEEADWESAREEPDKYDKELM